jgi:hypothetical protein
MRKMVGTGSGMKHPGSATLLPLIHTKFREGKKHGKVQFGRYLAQMVYLLARLCSR